MNKKRLFSSFSKILLCFTALVLVSFSVSAYYEFGGMFWFYLGDCHSPNPVTGACTCPDGFTEEEADGYDGWYCIKESSFLGDAIEFGGIYSTATASGGRPNTITGGYTCPDGFTSGTYADSGFFICYQNVSSPANFTDFGGMFNPEDHSDNPLTGSETCPSGFEQGVGWPDYYIYCYRNVTKTELHSTQNCVTTADCSNPCFVCVDRWGPDKVCIFACTEGYGCDQEANSGRGSCVVSGKPSFFMDCSASGGTTISTVAPELNIIGPDGEYVRPTWHPSQFLDPKHDFGAETASKVGDGWYSVEYKDNDGNTCGPILAYYVNLDQDEDYCTEHADEDTGNKYVWILGSDSGDMDLCPADTPGVCTGSTSGTCEDDWTDYQDVCNDLASNCQYWCKEPGTCWGDDNVAGEDPIEPLTSDYIPSLCEPPAQFLASAPIGAACCGDDETEATLSSDNQFLCGLTVAGAGEWLRSYWHAGRVKGFSGGMYLSDENQWLICDGATNGQIFTINAIPYSAETGNCIGCGGTTTHDYYCLDGVIAECRGTDADSTVHPSEGGVVVDFLGSYGIDAYKRFCTSDGRWVEADTSDDGFEECEAVSGIDHWTGIQCCDAGESYSEPVVATESPTGNGKACWNGDIVAHGEPANENVLNINGQFYGCYAASQGYVIAVDNCNISGNYYCSIINQNWTTPILEAADVLEEKETPISSAGPEACCVPDKCWDSSSSTCVENQVNEQYEPTTPDDEGNTAAEPYVFGGTDYRCINGEWQEAILRYDWFPTGIQDTDEIEHLGYCLTPSQCLYNKENPEPVPGTFYGYVGGEFDGTCVTSGTYDEYDNYCDNGLWTTRTKLVAQRMLNFASRSTDYTLYCGRETSVCDREGICSPDGGLYGVKNILTYLDYNVPIPFVDGWSTHTWLYGVQEFLDPYEGLVNSYCVLLYQEGGQQKAMFGASLNKDEFGGVGFIDVFGKDPQGCKVDFGYYEPQCPSDTMCNICNDGTMWFDNRTALLFYTKEGLVDNGAILYNEDGTLFNQFVNEMKTKRDSWVLGQISQPFPPAISNDYAFASLTRRFDQVYIRKTPTKEVRAILEEAGTFRPYFLVNYKNLGIDICPLIDSYEDAIPGEYFHCDGSAGNQWVLGGADRYDYPGHGVYPDYGTIGEYLPATTLWKATDIWADLTLKFRLE